MKEPRNLCFFGSFDDIGRGLSVQPLKGNVLTWKGSDDTHQMDGRIASFHTLNQISTFSNITCDYLYLIRLLQIVLRTRSHQSSHLVAPIQKSI